ncbi:uncharacterized protein M6G45_008971 isoform 1-T1 [Spheniscus humboldti]
MPSLERQGCRCQNASRQRRAKTHRRQRGGSGSPSRRGTHGGQAAQQRHGVAKAGRVADGGAGEERGATLEPAADAGVPGAPWLRSSTSAHEKAKASGRAPRRQTWLAPGEGAVTEGKRMSAMPSPRTTPTPACCSAPLKDPGCAQQHPCAQGCPLCTNTMRTNLPQGPRPPAPIACRSRGRGSAPGTLQHPALRTSASPWGACEARQEEPSHPIPGSGIAGWAGPLLAAPQPACALQLQAGGAALPVPASDIGIKRSTLLARDGPCCSQVPKTSQGEGSEKVPPAAWRHRHSPAASCKPPRAAVHGRMKPRTCPMLPVVGPGGGRQERSPCRGTLPLSPPLPCFPPYFTVPASCTRQGSPGTPARCSLQHTTLLP